MTPDEQLARMTKRYDLSADQQTQIKPIIANTQQQMMALRSDSSMSRDDKMAKMKTIREGSNTKIQALLNDSQKQKFAEDQQRHAGKNATTRWGSPRRRTSSPVTIQPAPASPSPGFAGDQPSRSSTGFHSLPSDCATAL